MADVIQAARDAQAAEHGKDSAAVHRRLAEMLDKHKHQLNQVKDPVLAERLRRALSTHSNAPTHKAIHGTDAERRARIARDKAAKHSNHSKGSHGSSHSGTRSVTVPHTSSKQPVHRPSSSSPVKTSTHRSSSSTSRSHGKVIRSSSSKSKPKVKSSRRHR